MTRQEDLVSEGRAAKRHRLAGRAADNGLANAVERAGGVLTGVNIKYDPYEVLLVIKAELPAGAMVAFVGASTICDGLIKATKAAESDALRWKADRWAKQGVD